MFICKPDRFLFLHIYCIRTTGDVCFISLSSEFMRGGKLNCSSQLKKSQAYSQSPLDQVVILCYKTFSAAV